MDEYDAIMVVKGLQIDNTCDTNDIALITLPFLRAKKQFLKEEMLLFRNIASTCVYTERINQRNILKFSKINSDG